MKEKQKTMRELPVVGIGDIEFTVHIDQHGFREVNNPENYFTVFDMLSLEDHHEFLFDKIQKRPVDDEWSDSLADNDAQRYEYIWIRRIESLDPVGMKALQSWKDYEKRLHRLPIVNIERCAFYWSNDASAFIEVANPWNIIYKNDIQCINGVQGFFYDAEKRVCPFEHEIEKYSEGSFPSHIKFIDVRELFKQLNIHQEQPSNSDTKQSGELKEVKSKKLGI